MQNLREALTAYRRAGRADLAATLCQALRAGHQAEVLRAIRPSPLPDRDPAAWFQD